MQVYAFLTCQSSNALCRTMPLSAGIRNDRSTYGYSSLVNPDRTAVNNIIQKDNNYSINVKITISKASDIGNLQNE